MYPYFGRPSCLTRISTVQRSRSRSFCPSRSLRSFALLIEKRVHSLYLYSLSSGRFDRTMFYEGDLQTGIAVAVQQSKAVLCYVYDDSELSQIWENEFFGGDEVSTPCARSRYLFLNKLFFLGRGFDSIQLHRAQDAIWFSGSKLLEGSMPNSCCTNGYHYQVCGGSIIKCSFRRRLTE